MPDKATEPQVVYHYTSIEAMTKIVDSKSIWATSICYLNDTSEGEHFLTLVKQRVPEFKRTHTVEDETLFDEGENILSDFMTRPFIASFSTDGDSLPQWRSYCHNGNGVAIGFSVDCLKRSTVNGANSDSADDTLEFSKVEYVDGSDTKSIDEAIIRAINSSKVMRTFWSTQKPQFEIKSSDHFQIYLSTIACAKKHKSFSNENEYRLIVHNLIGNRKAVEFRPVRSTIVPYVPVRVPTKRTGYKEPEDKSLQSHPVLASLVGILAGRSDFIDQVVIGPTPNKDLTRSAVKAFFEKCSMNVEVRTSDIPYRDL